MPTRGRPRRFDRDAALRVAMMLFWTHGYEGTSLNLLTSAMGITSTSLYAAFGTKEEIFREAIRLYNSPDSSPTDRALATMPTAREAIEDMLRANADSYVDPATPPGCMVVLAGLNLTSTNKGIGEYLAECRREDQAKVERRLARGVEDGELPADADITAMASYYMTVLHGLSIRARDGCTREEAHAVIDGAMLTWDQLATQ